MRACVFGNDQADDISSFRPPHRLPGLENDHSDGLAPSLQASHWGPDTMDRDELTLRTTSQLLTQNPWA